MSVTVMALLSVNENEPRALAEYLDVTAPLIERAGAKIVKRFAIHEAVVGDRPAMTTVLVEYPSRSAVDQVFQSAEYKSIQSVRDRAFDKYEISIVASEETIPQAAEQPSD